MSSPAPAPPLGSARRWRRQAGRAVVLLYAALLALAAVPPKLRPGLLGAPGRLAERALGALSISPGLAVFSGSVTSVHRRAGCLEIRARFRGGATETLYASECPPTGFRWRIDPWDEMVEGLVRRTRIERFVRAPGEPEPPASYELLKLQALGDYFCHSPLVSPRVRAEVSLEWRSLLVLYSSGIHTEDRPVACRWRCGAGRFDAPECTRLAPRAPDPPPRA